MPKIALIIVLYNPNEEEVRSNISSYTDAVDLIITIDNSEISKHTLSNNNKTIHIRNNNNLGIAKALNQGIKKAIEEKYRYVVLMDQDSLFFNASKAIPELFYALKDKEKNFMASSLIINAGIAPTPNKSRLTYVESCITSGTMIDLSMTEVIGLHDEKLFIDYVDFEYCLRAKNLGYEIVKANYSTLKHQIGDSKKSSLWFFPWYKTYTTNHSPIRRYYRWRNALYIWDKYKSTHPKWVRKNKKQTFSDLKKIILFEENKIQKIKAIYLALIDAKKGIYGKRDFL